MIPEERELIRKLDRSPSLSFNCGFFLQPPLFAVFVQVYLFASLSVFLMCLELPGDWSIKTPENEMSEL